MKSRKYLLLNILKQTQKKTNTDFETTTCYCLLFILLCSLFFFCNNFSLKQVRKCHSGKPTYEYIILELNFDDISNFCKLYEVTFYGKWVRTQR